MVAGLEETSEGTIRIGNRDVTMADPSERGVAMVFQTYALYPHMTVAENMGFGLKMTGHPKAEIDRKVAEAARILKLDELLSRKPKALSGGQRQRVAIGRAIVRGPEVFLFDEPFGALDEITRERLNDEVLHLFQSEGFAGLFITHSISEAVYMSTKVLVMSARPGRIIASFDVPFGLNRTHDLRYEPQFAELCGEISHALRGAHQ
jgi:lactose/L-arabinose transport system ATP-binding protein